MHQTLLRPIRMEQIPAIESHVKGDTEIPQGKSKDIKF